MYDVQNINCRCGFFDHEICSLNLRKAILYQSKSLVKIIIRSHRIAFLKNPQALIVTQDKSTIVNMMDAFRYIIWIINREWLITIK